MFRVCNKEISNQRGATFVEYALILMIVAMGGIAGLSNLSVGTLSAFENVSCGALGGTYMDHPPFVPAFGVYHFEWAWQNDDGSGCLVSTTWSSGGGGDDGGGEPPDDGGGKGGK